MTKNGINTAARHPRSWRVFGTLALISPSFIILGLVFLAPLAVLLSYSVFHYVPGGLVKAGFTTENFTRFFTDTFNIEVLITSLELGAMVAFVSVILGLPTAYFIARTQRGALRAILYGLLLIPLVTNIVVKSYGWQLILGQDGLVNTTLGGLGFPKIQVVYTLTGTVVAMSSMLMPFMILALVPVMQSVDEDLELAAQTLGATRRRAFWDVVLPIAGPGVSAGFIIVFVLAVGSYAAPALIGGGKVFVIPMNVYDQALGAALNYPFAAAMAAVLLLVVLCLSALEAYLLARSRKWAAHGEV